MGSKSNIPSTLFCNRLKYNLILVNYQHVVRQVHYNVREVMAFKEWDSAVYDEPRLPRRDSIARWLLQNWLDGLDLS